VRIPTANRDYWTAKLRRNSDRDKRNLALLAELGWEATTVWECQLDDLDSVATRLVDFLD